MHNFACILLDDVKELKSMFSWCSGYHICLTHRRSPVRSRAKTFNVPRGLTARISGFHPEGPGSTPGVGTFSTYVPLDHFALLWNKSNNLSHDDKVAEWLRRWTANPMCSARVGSNPILVVIVLSGPENDRLPLKRESC